MYTISFDYVEFSLEINVCVCISFVCLFGCFFLCLEIGLLKKKKKDYKNCIIYYEKNK